MTSAFRFLDDIALADAAFEARGDTPAELCAAAARAVLETLADPNTVSPVVTKRIVHESDTLDGLLFDWLSDLVYLKDAEGLVFHAAACDVTTDQSDGIWRLTGTVTGEPADPARHELRADIKAITKHRYGVRRDDGGWTATVVMDI